MHENILCKRIQYHKKVMQIEKMLDFLAGNEMLHFGYSKQDNAKEKGE